MLGSKNSRILVLSDLHAPFGHIDTIPFLRALKEKYNPDRVISVGDEIDGHAISFHNHSPELLSPKDELLKAIDHLKPIYKMFPNMDICESNHGSLVYRKGEAMGLPRHVLKSYREILEAPKGWKWHSHITLKMSNDQWLYICHSKGGNSLRCSQAIGMSYVAGHEHSKFDLQYWGNSLGLNFAMTVGCLIDDDSLAFAYNKLSLKRPVIGCAVIIDGIPNLIPMVLNKEGRWIKTLPKY